MTDSDASTVRVYSTLSRMSKQRLPKHAGDTPANAEEHAVHRQAVPVPQAATETSECTNDVRGRWTDDGGQNTTTLMEGAQSF